MHVLAWPPAHEILLLADRTSQRLQCVHAHTNCAADCARLRAWLHMTHLTDSSCASHTGSQGHRASRQWQLSPISYFWDMRLGSPGWLATCTSQAS